MSKFFFLSLLANKSWLWKFVAPDRFFSIKLRNYKHFVLILTGELCTIQSQWLKNLKTPNLTIVAVCIILASFFYTWLAFSMTTIDIPQIFLISEISLYNQRLYKLKVQMQKLTAISKMCKFIFSTERAIVSISSWEWWEFLLTGIELVSPWILWVNFCLFVCLFYIVRPYTTCPLLGDYVGIFDF